MHKEKKSTSSTDPQEDFIGCAIECDLTKMKLTPHLDSFGCNHK